MLLFLLKPIWNYLQSWYTGKPVKTADTLCEGGTCCLPSKQSKSTDDKPLIIDGVNLIKVSQTDGENLFSRIKNSDGAIVRFTAAWCGPCKKIEPYFNELSKVYTHIVFASVDVDENAEIAEESGVTALPAFHFYKNGEVLGITKGSNEAAIEDLLNEHGPLSASEERIKSD